MKKCITCEKEIKDQEGIEKHDVNFCNEECLKLYEEKIEQLNKDMDWENCC